MDENWPELWEKKSCKIIENCEKFDLNGWKSIYSENKIVKNHQKLAENLIKLSKYCEKFIKNNKSYAEWLKLTKNVTRIVENYEKLGEIWQ